MKAATTAVLLAVLGALPSTALGIASFKTPRGAAYCGESEGEGPPGLICWTPNDGYSIVIEWDQRGRPAPGIYNPGDRGNYEPGARTLAFGAAWSADGFRCMSRTAGLTCINRRGHGFWLGRLRGVKRF